MNNPFEMIEARLSSIENLILDIKHQPKEVEKKEREEALLTVQETAEFLKLSIATIYSKKSKGELPFCKPFGSKRVYFSKQALISYVMKGKSLSNDEVNEIADSFINSNTGGNEKI